MNLRTLITLPVLAVAVTTAGCGDHHHHDLTPGEADEAAVAACALFDGDAAPVPVTATAEDGPTIGPEAHVWRIALEPGENRTVDLLFPEEHTTFALFWDRPEVSLGLDSMDGSLIPIIGDIGNGACPEAGLGDVRIHVHTLGPHPLLIPDDASGVIHVYLHVTEVGH